MKWLPFELHTHTPHSDGIHTLLEMCRKAAELGFRGIALTDHNTTSGMADAAQVTEETGVAIIPGLEWTTFYGHMLTLGVPYCEWRDLGPKDIHKGIDRVHRQGGVVGIAHPFSLGSPICTGCHWEYEIQDWNQVDYMEVWHETLPPMRNHNAPAFEQWTNLLNQGYRIAGTAGRDWHHSNDESDPPAYTYLGIVGDTDALTKEQAVDAIRTGRICISMGPLVTIELQADGQSYHTGDVIRRSDCANVETVELTVRIDHPSIASRRQMVQEEGLTVIVESNLGECCRSALADGATVFQHSIRPEKLLWLRVRLYGMLSGVLSTIAFTNPIYFED
ncbi:histidinol phosphatase [Paenibacillus selenitireducens]|uniref:Histidinol phosphatase n=1 Tax=Paenibacillus selenitireducens TaxID=1324314 RepID=A0A1T2XLZ9_9BACL|nr:CehA/McbA family metallohydrolase [Paenibacillus selenitireducens]OPA80889.1 histidinol phosphatase [Paenibacillus selenitireducens]